MDRSCHTKRHPALFCVVFCVSISLLLLRPLWLGLDMIPNLFLCKRHRRMLLDHLGYLPENWEKSPSSLVGSFTPLRAMSP